jgi:paraquat-inducible protein B
MDERGHSVLIGAFVVGALVVGLGAVLFFAGGGFGGPREKVVMVFDGSIKGLTIGAPVALRGVQIGQVTDIRVMLDQAKADLTMVVEAELNSDLVQVRGHGEGLSSGGQQKYLIDRGLRAQLQMQSVLTGLLFVQLDFHPDTPATYVELEERQPQIPTVPTELEVLRRTLQSVDYAALIEAAQVIAASLRAFVENEDFRALPGELRAALAALEGAGAGVDESLDSLQPRLVRTLDAMSGAAESLSGALPDLSSELSASLVRMNDALAATRDAMAGVGGQFAPGSPTLHQLNSTLLELGRASRALQSFLQVLEDQPDALLRGRRAGDAP